MSRRQTVRIDEPSLGLVVAAIAEDSRVSALFQQAATGMGLWATGQDAAHVRMRELRMCIHQRTWRVESDRLDRVLWKRVAQHLRRPGRISTLARRIRNDLAIRLRSLFVAVEVKGLTPSASQIKLGAFTFGTVGNVVRGANSNVDASLEAGKIARIDPVKTMVISFKVELPQSDRLDPRWLWQRAEEGLNLLAVSCLRRWEETGPVWNLQTGMHSWSWTGPGSKASMQWNRIWMRDMSYEVVPDWLEARERTQRPPEVKAKGLPRFRTRLDAYTTLPRGDLREDFEAAYNALGEAARLLPNSAASVALAWSAFERAYGLENSYRQARSIANCLKLASAAKGTFQHPVEVVNLYILRNQAVHRALQLHWTERQGLDRLGTVYGHIEALLEYCLAEGFATRRQVNAAIDTAEHRAVAKKWAEDSRKDQLAERGLSILPAHQARLDRSIRLWKQVEELLERVRSAPTQPKKPGPRK